MENLLPPFKGNGKESTDVDTAPLSISHLHWKNVNYDSNSNQDENTDDSRRGDKENDDKKHLAADISLAYAKAKGKTLRELKEDLQEANDNSEISRRMASHQSSEKKVVEIAIKGGGGEYLVTEEIEKNQESNDFFPEEDGHAEEGETGAGIGGIERGGKFQKKQVKEQKLWKKKKMMGPSPLSVHNRGTYEEMAETIKLPEEKTILKSLSYLTVLNGVDDNIFDIFACGVTNKNNIIHRPLPSQSTFTTLIYGNPLPLALPPHLTDSFEKGLSIQEIKRMKQKRQEEIRGFMYQQSYDKINTGLLLSFISELSLAQQERGGNSSYTVKFEPCLSLGLDLAFDKKLQLVYVHNVKPDTQADENGCIKQGDYVREIQGIHVTNLKQISLIAEARNKKEVVSIRFERKKSKQQVAATKSLLSSFFQQELETLHTNETDSQRNNKQDSINLHETTNKDKEFNYNTDEGKEEMKDRELKAKEDKQESQEKEIAGKLLYEDEDVLLAERTVLGNDATTTALMDGDNTNDNIISKINNDQDPVTNNQTESKISQINNTKDWNTKFRLRKLKDIARMLTISEEDDIPIIFNFQNQSLRYNIKVGWVDYEGKRHGRNILGPGKAYMEQSYSSHPWLLRLEDTAIPESSSLSSEAEENKMNELHDGKSASEKRGFDRKISGPDHGLLLRVGIEAASAGAYHTILWNPEMKSTSIMGMQKADGGRLTRLENEIKNDPTNSDLNSYENRKLRYSMQQLIQERRDATDVSVAGVDSKGLGGWKGPLVTVILVDKDPRLKI